MSARWAELLTELRRETPLKRLALFGFNRPAVTVGLWTVLLALGLFGMNRLSLRTSNLDLVSEDEQTVANFLDFGRLFGAPNVIFLVLQCDQASVLEETIDELGREIRHLAGVKVVLERLPLADDRLDEQGLDPYFPFR